jgi:hypothetical protein
MDLILMGQYFGLDMLSTKLLHLYQTITSRLWFIIYQTHKINIVEKIPATRTYNILMWLAQLPRMIQLFVYNNLAIPMT